MASPAGLFVFSGLRNGQTIQKILDLLFGVFFGDAVVLLNLAGKLLAIALNHVSITIGEFSPLGSQLALKYCFHLPST